MNRLFIVLASLVAASGAFASEVQIFKNAQISICGDSEMGCSSHLSSGTNVSLSERYSFLIDQSYPAAAEFLKKSGHLQTHVSFSIKVREVMGVVVTETGHFPNPTAAFATLKIIAIIE